MLSFFVSWLVVVFVAYLHHRKTQKIYKNSSSVVLSLHAYLISALGTKYPNSFCCCIFCSFKVSENAGYFDNYLDTNVKEVGCMKECKNHKS